ncbi:hypothetical protein TNCV_4980351 [Trichonephila clavipes]|nr:hypothetical protein TNCV_4980351 [Trichonephila clavipes]
MFDPKTRKNVVNDKNCDETVTRPNMDKEVENSYPSVFMQFATQAAILKEPTSYEKISSLIVDSAPVTHRRVLSSI